MFEIRYDVIRKLSIRRLSSGGRRVARRWLLRCDGQFSSRRSSCDCASTRPENTQHRNTRPTRQTLPRLAPHETFFFHCLRPVKHLALPLLILLPWAGAGGRFSRGKDPLHHLHSTGADECSKQLRVLDNYHIYVLWIIPCLYCTFTCFIFSRGKNPPSPCQWVPMILTSNYY